MRTELEQLAGVVDRVRERLHPSLPTTFLHKVIVIVEDAGGESSEALARIRSLVDGVIEKTGD